MSAITWPRAPSRLTLRSNAPARRSKDDGNLVRQARGGGVQRFGLGAEWRNLTRREHGKLWGALLAQQGALLPFTAPMPGQEAPRGTATFEASSKNIFLNGDTYANRATVSTGSSLDPVGVAAKRVVVDTATGGHSQGNITAQSISGINTTPGSAIDLSFSGYFAPYGPLNYKPYLVFTMGETMWTNMAYALLRFNAATGAIENKSFNTGWSEVIAPVTWVDANGMRGLKWTVRYTQQATPARAYFGFLFQIWNELNQQSYTGDGASGFEYAKIQIEPASAPTAHILTTTAQVTRPQGPCAKGSSAKGATSVPTEGWTALTTSVLKAGDWIKFAGHAKVYRVTDDAGSDFFGAATLAIAPPLQAAVADDELLTISSVPITWDIDGSVLESTVRTGMIFDAAVDLVEEP